MIIQSNVLIEEKAQNKNYTFTTSSFAYVWDHQVIKDVANIS